MSIVRNFPPRRRGVRLWTRAWKLPAFPLIYIVPTFGNSVKATLPVFLGADDVLLDSFTLGELFENGSGPVGSQGFVGFADDLGRAIHKVSVAPADCYFDNLYFELGPTGAETDTWSAVKALYR